MYDDELIARYRNGETLKEIAKAAGVEPQTISNRVSNLREHLPYRRKPHSCSHPRRQLAAARRELVLKLHEQGVPAKEIAARVGIGEMYVYQLIWKGKPKKSYQHEIERLRSQLV
jgi:DNA-binding NarL/FixJ family response regulator